MVSLSDIDTAVRRTHFYLFTTMSQCHSISRCQCFTWKQWRTDFQIICTFASPLIQYALHGTQVYHIIHIHLCTSWWSPNSHLPTTFFRLHLSVRRGFDEEHCVFHMESALNSLALFYNSHSHKRKAHLREYAGKDKLLELHKIHTIRWICELILFYINLYY